MGLWEKCVKVWRCSVRKPTTLPPEHGAGRPNDQNAEIPMNNAHCAHEVTKGDKDTIGN